MTYIQEIANSINGISSIDDLVSFIDINYEKIQKAFYGSNFDDLKANRELVENILSSIEEKKLLNENNNHSSINAFLITLADFYDRFQSRTEVIEVKKYLPECSVKLRLKAAETYLLANDVEDYITKIDTIIKFLNEAHQEEDFKHRVSISLVNYYLFAFRHLKRVSEEKLERFKVAFNTYRTHYDIFDSKLVGETLENVSSITFDEDFLTIQELIRDLELNYLKLYLPDSPKTIDFDEEASDYEKDYKSITNKSFDVIQNLSNKYLPNNSRLFTKLNRGIAIIDETDLLYQYVYSYGSMHQHKLIDSFKKLPFNDFYSKTIDIFDYGCGQGIATIVLNDFFVAEKIHVEFNSIVLIEPSEIALKRAYLHIKYGHSNFKKSEITQINKDLDNLEIKDLKTETNNIKIHLFSNILDVPFFDLDLLIEKLMLTQSGINYFICVSPYVDDLRNKRVDYFMNMFSRKFKTIVFSDRVNSKVRNKWRCKRIPPPNKCNHHDLDCYCENCWTRYEKIFQTVI